jgi:hypothetical protein
MQSRSGEHVASGKSTANGIKPALLGKYLRPSRLCTGCDRKSSRKNLKLAELRADPPQTKTDLVSATFRAELRYWLPSAHDQMRG